MDDLQHAEIVTRLTEIRDEFRAFIRLMQEPAPEPAHVHAPADGSSPRARVWTCGCGYVHERT